MTFKTNDFQWNTGYYCELWFLQSAFYQLLYFFPLSKEIKVIELDLHFSQSFLKNTCWLPPFAKIFKHFIKLQALNSSGCSYIRTTEAQRYQPIGSYNKRVGNSGLKLPYDLDSHPRILSTLGSHPVTHLIGTDLCGRHRERSGNRNMKTSRMPALMIYIRLTETIVFIYKHFLSLSISSFLELYSVP